MNGFRGCAFLDGRADCGRFRVERFGQPWARSVIAVESPDLEVVRDLSWAADDSSTSVFAGLLDNRLQACKLLDLTPDSTPAAIVGEAWRRGAVRLIRDLDGVFAFALIAGSELLLYRDRSGLQNLFWCRTDQGAIAFATDLQALLALPGVGRRVARESLQEYLRFLDVSAPRTVYEGVHALEAGHLLRLTTGAVECLDSGAQIGPTAAAPDFETAVVELGKLLHASVQAQLEGSQRPAAFLSGGVDSSLVCSAMARLRPDATVLTVGFEAGSFDEAEVAATVAARLGLRHEVLRFSSSEYREAFERAGAGMEQPTADPALAATVLALDRCRDRFDALLDGTGADEAVGAMPPRHVRVAVGWASLLPRTVRRLATRGLQAIPPLARFSPILDFEHPAETMIRWHGFTRAEIEALCDMPVSLESTHFYRTFSVFPRRAHFARYSALIDAMPCERLNQAMRISGYRLHFPFTARAVDRYLRQLPLAFRHLPGEPKRILRELLAQGVPRAIWDRPKHGFDFPLADFLRANDHAIVRRHLDPSRWQPRALLSASAIQAYGQRFIAGDGRLLFRVWALAVLDTWLAAHHDPG